MKAWNITRTQYKVSDLLTWYKNDELDLSPYFQRRAVWKPLAKSYLIDTVIRGLPIPPIILREVPSDLRSFTPRREVVDGQQRIRTVISYIYSELLKDRQESDEFTLRKMHNFEYAGLSFSDLPKSARQTMLDYQFMVFIFPSDTDDREILEIFARMNATGYKLTNQELRNARFFGEFKTCCFTLAAEQLGRWRSWSLFNDNQIARMAEVELTSECLILILNGVTEGNKATIDRYYKDNNEEFPDRTEVEKRFRFVMDQIDQKFDASTREPFSGKTLFYPLFAAIYDGCYGINSPLKQKRGTVLNNSDVTAIAAAGRRISSGDAPEAIQKITERRVSQAGVRRRILSYLLKRVSWNARSNDR